MAKDIKTRISLDGDTKYRQAIKNIDNELTKLNSEMKVVTSAFDKNNATIKDLTNANQVLTKQIQSQSDKVSILRQVVGESNKKYKEAQEYLEKMTKEHGENSKEVEEAQKNLEKYQKQLNNNQNTLNNATAYLNKLTNQYNSNMDAVEKLSKSSEKLDNAQNDISSSAEKSTKKSSELAEVFKKIASISLDSVDKSLEKVATATKNITVAGIKAVTETVEASTKAFTAYATAITTATTALASSSVKIGMSFTEQMSTVQALSGYTDGSQQSISNMEALEEKAKELGATTSFTATEVGKAFEYMAMAGWGSGGPEKMLASIQSIVDLTSATGAELGTVSDIVTDAMTAFGEDINTESVQHFADVLAKTTTSSNTNIEQLGEAFKYIGPAANSLNYSIDDVSMALGVMANAGVKGEQAGAALRTALARLASPTETVSAVMKRLNISLADKDGNTLSFADMLDQLRNKLKGVSVDLVDASGNARDYDEIVEELQNKGQNQQLQLISDASNLFGKNQMASMLTLINATDEEFEQLKESIENASGSAQAMAKVKLDNLSGDVTLLQSAWEGVGNSIFDYLETPVRGAVQSVTDLVTNINNNLSGGISFDGIISNIGTFKDSIISQFENLFQSILEGFSGYKSTFNAILSETFEGMLDIFPQVVGQMLPIASTGFWDLTNNIIEQITTSIPEIVSSSNNFILSFDNGLISASKNLQNSLPTIVSNLFSGITKVAPTFITMGGEILSTFFQGLTTSIPEFSNALSSVFDSLLSQNDLSATISNMLDAVHWALVNSVPEILSVLSESISNIFETISNEDFSMKFIGLIRMVTDDVKDTLIEVVPELASSFPDILNTFIQPIADALIDPELLNALVAGIVNMVSALVDFIANNTQPLINAILQMVTTLSDSLIENMDTILPAIATFIEGILLGVADNIEPLLNSLLRLIGTIGDVLTSPSVIGKLLVSISETIDEVLMAVVGNIGTLAETIMDVALGVVGVLLEPGNISAILQVISEVFTAVVLALPSLLVGLVDVLATFEGSISDWVMSIDWGDLGNRVIEGIVSGFERAWNYASEAITNIGNHIVEGFKSFFGIASPSGLMKEKIGEFIVPGIAEGVEDNAKNSAENISNSLNKMVQTIDFNGVVGTMTTNLDIPANFENVVNAKSSDIISTSNIDVNNNSDTSNIENLLYSILSAVQSNNSRGNQGNNMSGIFAGATININNNMDIETLAEKIQFEIDKQRMGVGA